MKKLVLLLAVAFSVSMFSCGGGEKTEACDSTCTDSCPATEEVVAPATDSVVAAADTVVAEVTEAPADTTKAE